MHRSRVDVCALALVTLFAASCSAPPERSIVKRFFAAARLRDNTLLGRIATVTFEPLQQGIVVDFEITNVTPEREGRKEVTVTAPVRLPDGRVAVKTLVMTLQRDDQNDGAEADSAWIVTGIREM
jgi:hypothetical protein